MGVPVKEKIKRFLESAVARVEDCEIVLYQVNIAGRKSPVWTSEKKWMIDDASVSIAEIAQDMADDGQSIARFTIQALDPEVDHDPIIMGFALAPRDVAGEDNSSFEPLMMGVFDSEANSSSEVPSVGNLLVQLMRHNSDLQRQMVQIIKLQNLQSDQVERLEIEKMNAALIDKKHRRDMEIKQIESGFKRKDEIFGKMMALLPLVTRKLAGKKI